LPDGLAFDGDGNVYIADSFNSRISRIDICGVCGVIPPVP
jgi:sugar lactone lactonase YvrE